MHRHYRWEALAWDGREHLSLRWDSDGIEARGVAIGSREGVDYGLSYLVHLTPDWVVRRLAVERTDGAAFALVSDGAGHWQDGTGAALPGLEGCIDIDLSGSPFTNSLPINRIRWVDQRPERFDMAWVPLDSLTPFRDGQVYTRLREGRFRYQAVEGDFEAELSVDAEGVVIDYPGLFRRV